ncbi:MAG: response regulator [Deltaproteobacteria bacterium]|nr:response regulator [Deltaproteobacteria bacterium]
MKAACPETHPHILLAEDDSDLRELLDFALTQAGFLVSCCDNGLQLLEMLEQNSTYDLVVSDLRMPALTGLEVLESQYDNRQRPPFICMTAFGDQQTHDMARRFGVAATIDKPFDLDEMIKLVQTTCRRQPNHDLPVRNCP